MKKLEYEVKEDIDFYEYNIHQETCYGMGDGFGVNDYSHFLMNDDYFLMEDRTCIHNPKVNL